MKLSAGKSRAGNRRGKGPAGRGPKPKSPTSAIITLTTDFGGLNPYVAQMKLAILRRCRDARIIDVSHSIPRHDVLAGAVALERAVAAAPAGTVHVAIVDPGVGTGRRIIVAKIAGQFIVCPDNGLITWAHRRHGRISVNALGKLPSGISSTFHGRDVMAPLAAELAGGHWPRGTRAVGDPVLLDVDVARGGAGDTVRGRAIQIDNFGNVTTNIPAEILRGGDAVLIGSGKSGSRTLAILRAYADVAIGKPLALVGSSGLVEIAVRQGSAQQKLGLGVGDAVTLRRPRKRSRG
jgi:S-adenosyl-L-methionine hydrolase (adenosine-forming)